MAVQTKYNLPNDFEINGTILAINKTRPAKEGSAFMLRDFWIKKQEAGVQTEIKFQLGGNNCPIMDNFLPGDKVVVKFSLDSMPCKVPTDGTAIMCDTNPTGLTGYRPNLSAYEVEFEPGYFRNNPNIQQPQGNPQNQAPQASNYQQTSAYNPAPQGNYNQAPAYNQGNQPKPDPRLGTINHATGQNWTQKEIDDYLPF